jgi:aldose 1-epimerase
LRPSPASADDNRVGLAPALGWSSWGFIRRDPTAAKIEAQADAMKSSGLVGDWVLSKTGPRQGGLSLAARAWDPASGRQLTLWTDQPGVQFCAGNFLTGTVVGISGHIYRQTDGYTFETHHFPNSANEPNFPFTEPEAGQLFNSTTVFQFSR